MAKYTLEMEKIFDSVFSGSSIDPKSGKMVVSDPAAFAEADATLKSVIERVAKEKWLMKENTTDSLSHMAGLIDFSELAANPSSAKTSKAPVKPSQAPAGIGESTKSSLGFGKVFNVLKEFDASSFGDNSDANVGDEVVDGNDSFDAAQIGAGDEGVVSGSDADMGSMDETDPSLLGDQQMGGQMGGQMDPMGGQQDPMGGIDGDIDGDNPLDFDLSDLSSFDQIGGQQGGQAPVGDDFAAGQQGQQGQQAPISDPDELV